MALFEFNDDFIAAVACGTSDEDVLELFTESIRAGADELEKRLIAGAGAAVAAQATYVPGAFEIPLDEAQFDAEFGGGGEAPGATIRRAIIGSVIPGSRAMTKVLDAD